MKEGKIKRRKVKVGRKEKERKICRWLSRGVVPCSVVHSYRQTSSHSLPCESHYEKTAIYMLHMVMAQNTTVGYC
jgi:hypothetical protein